MSWLKYKPGTYKISAFAIFDNNPILRGAPKNFTVRSTAATVDVLNANGITGWAWKPDAPNESIAVHVYIYDSSHKLVHIEGVLANLYRSDLHSLGFGNGYHGYHYSIPWSKLPKGNLYVDAYAVDWSDHHIRFHSSLYNNR
jgi:hypothetical protein